MSLTRMRKFFLSYSLLFYLSGRVFFGSHDAIAELDYKSLTSTQKIILQCRIEREARDLIKAGRLEDAVIRYREALNPDLLNRESDKCTALWGIVRIHQWQNQYPLVLSEFDWFLKMNPKQPFYVDKKAELEAITQARAIKSTKPVYQYIDDLRKKYRNALPPHLCDSNASSKIIYAYDYIGDFDGGIAFCDEALRYWEKKSGQDLHRPGNKNQYFLIRQAFEQDQKEGFKGCMDAKSGEVCMGRATQAIIRSGYFPW